MSSLLKHCHGEKTHFSRNGKRTYKLNNSPPQSPHKLKAAPCWQNETKRHSMDNNDLLPIEWRFVRFSNSYVSLIKLSAVCREAAFLTLISYARENTLLPFLMPIGALFAILCLLFSRTAAMRARDVFLLLGLGFHLILLLVSARRTLAESHSATRDYLVDVHVQNVLGINGGKVLRP